jgi:4'-phosphopantetheinyl transferase
MSPQHWRLPPERVTLHHNDEVHVWRSLLDLPGEYVHQLAEHLADDERARAARFHFERDRARFIIAHGVLRLILSRYLNDQAPRDLRFTYNAYGKPALDRSATNLDLYFSLSHSRDLALMAVTRGREIGIDVEYVRPDLAEERLAERVFSPGELAALRQLPRQARVEAFFAGWTRKEAYVKGRGEGLSLPLRAFEVSALPGEAAVCMRVSGVEPVQWSLREICPGCGYVAALAVAGTVGQLSFWQWPRL